MIKRIMLCIALAATLSAATATVVVALAFSLFAVAEPSLGRAGAAGAVALAFAVLAGIAALAIALQIKGPGRHKRSREPSLADRLTDLARDRPILAAGGALAAGLVALRNPQVIASIVAAVLAARAEKTGRGRR